MICATLPHLLRQHSRCTFNPPTPQPGPEYLRKRAVANRHACLLFPGTIEPPLLHQYIPLDTYQSRKKFPILPPGALVPGVSEEIIHVVGNDQHIPLPRDTDYLLPCLQIPRLPGRIGVRRHAVEHEFIDPFGPRPAIRDGGEAIRERDVRGGGGDVREVVAEKGEVDARGGGGGGDRSYFTSETGIYSTVSHLESH